MTLKEQIMKLQTYKMYEGEDTVYVERDDVLKALDQESITWIVGKDNCQVAVRNMPIDKMQKICAIIEDEGQQPCEDCISREAVIEHICEAKECYKEECKGRTLKRCPDLQWVFDLPSVTPKAKVGHWEYVQYDYNPDLGNWHCSECRCICTEMHSIEDAYCPNCGAKMTESEGKE